MTAPYLPTTAIAELTTTTLTGDGVFDILMRANKVHLQEEFEKGRIKGSEYATVYLGSLQAVMQASLQFLMQREKSVVEIGLLEQQIANAILEGEVLKGQKCKLDAEFDLLQSTNLKTTQEIQLLLQKTNTEKAQTVALGVEDNSVVGKQKLLYAAQTDGFSRDAEQKAAKVMADTWNVRRTTDDATSANTTNKLDDGSVGRAINKLLVGVNA